ncbi:hypothetical protein NDU88_008108 [Pleurodeles waltl]|uniref:Uncharacterized protein n=1 Tax=Pleurodeles waltl TaxID=8319 RepID=A0AAV7QNZ5_PLEWA|nr:hypothetical protein NDU88_008108 [Pleurodeles waltl]
MEPLDTRRLVGNRKVENIALRLASYYEGMQRVAQGVRVIVLSNVHESEKQVFKAEARTMWKVTRRLKDIWGRINRGMCKVQMSIIKDENINKA